MNREQLRQLAVSGTVTFPATFPRLAEIRLREHSSLPMAVGNRQLTSLVAVERASLRVTLSRYLPVSDVRAVFLPRDPHCVHVDDGTWLLGPEIEVGVRMKLNEAGRVFGIVYVAEQTSTLLEVQAGMTAAESSQYYPPLPCDQSVNHYDPFRQQEPRESVRPVRAERESYRPTPCESFQYSHESTMCEPSAEQHSASEPCPRPTYCEPDDVQQKLYRTLRVGEDFEPAPFPFDGDQS